MSENVRDNIGENLKRLRKEMDMSQDDIASRLNTARPVISNWERSVAEPSASQLVKLAQVLGVSVDALVSSNGDGKKVVVLDTSMLIKRPAIVKELLEKFDELIIPSAVIDELNNQKDQAARLWLKRRALLVMHIIDELRDKNKKIMIPDSKGTGDKNDEKIARIAIERASQTFSDKVYVFANDIWFSYLVKEKQSNLFLLTYDDYIKDFFENKNFFDMEKTQNFMSTLKNKEFKKIKAWKYDSEIDINYVDPETGYTPLIQGRTAQGC
jgi:transcriptional regulator with XRE-family HTH domain